MGRLRPDSRIIRLVEPEPLRIAGRTVLVLEYVGDERDAPTPATPPRRVHAQTRRREETVARQLRDTRPAPVDQLEAYGDYLFGAVDFLEGESVWHRDIKPDNIAIRIRPNRTRELVLIDFSLAGYPAKETDAGTDGYLDPFIGTLTRPLVRLARRAVRRRGHPARDGLAASCPSGATARCPPRQTDPKKLPYPTIAADAFEPGGAGRAASPSSARPCTGTRPAASPS